MMYALPCVQQYYTYFVHQISVSFEMKKQLHYLYIAGLDSIMKCSAPYLSECKLLSLSGFMTSVGP